RLEAESPQKSGEHEHGLHHRETVADEDAPTAAEGKEDVIRQPSGRPLEASLGAETFSLLEPSRIAMEDPRRKINRRTSRNRVTAERAIGESLPADHVGGRIEPKCLFDHRLRVGQARKVFRAGKTIAENPGDLAA